MAKPNLQPGPLKTATGFLLGEEARTGQYSKPICKLHQEVTVDRGPLNRTPFLSRYATHPFSKPAYDWKSIKQVSLAAAFPLSSHQQETMYPFSFGAVG